MARGGVDWTTLFAWAIVILGIVALMVLLVGINWVRAGGDWGCVFTQEPQICVAIKGGAS